MPLHTFLHDLLNVVQTANKMELQKKTIVWHVTGVSLNSLTGNVCVGRQRPSAALSVANPTLQLGSSGSSGKPAGKGLAYGLRHRLHRHQLSTDVTLHYNALGSEPLCCAHDLHLQFRGRHALHVSRICDQRPRA
jgi:hypothetical protein